MDDGACWFPHEPPCGYCHLDITYRDATMIKACILVCDGASVQEAADTYNIPMLAITVAMKDNSCPQKEHA